MIRYAPNNVCPRCGGGVPSNDHVGEYPGALSRWDNDTEICSACGVEEALLSIKSRDLLHPTKGERVWVDHGPWDD